MTLASGAPRHALLLAALLAVAGAAPRYTPHLVARLPTKAERRKVGSGKRIATISALYEVDTMDWDGMKLRTADRMAAALEGISPDYIETVNVEAIVIGVKCIKGAVRCNRTGGGLALRSPGTGGAGLDGDLNGTDPRECEALIPSNPIIYEQYLPKTFAPQWQRGDAAQLQAFAFATPVCVSPVNTSLYQTYYTSLQNVFVTGWRDNTNSYISSNPGRGIRFELHVVGRIPVIWAEFLNVKFILNGSIPMPLYQPEVVDESAYWTDRLNVSVQILGLRQADGGGVGALVTSMPVCIQPTIQMRGCFRIDQTLFDHPKMSEYKLKAYLSWRRHFFVRVASDLPWQRGDFNISEGPWPLLHLWQPEAPPGGPWRQWRFPQKESVYQADCHNGNACATLPLAPSLRHMHSAVLYRSWNFERHARRYLCDERPECGTDCLTNLTCLGGPSYYDQSFYFRSGQFRNDDGGTVPKIGLDDIDCPEACCADRRLCMRLHDVMGYEVPFDAEYMLVFGGKTYAHRKGPSGKLVYHNCERIPRSELLLEWRSCAELTVGDLWRYDIVRGKWDYIKPDSAISPTTLLPVGYPLARFGHSAVLVEEVDAKDPGSKRVYMYIYGGMGPLCDGVCTDVWRYEVPWAAQAYYPKFPDGPWNRGNVWERLKDCPFGGLYRHRMVATSGNEYVYIYGGQVLGGFRDALYRYRISTDMWEDLNPYGRVSLTRLMYDFSGAPRPREVPTSQYDAALDVDCSVAWRFDGAWQHCRICTQCGLRTGHRGEGAEFPEPRGDYAMVAIADHTPGAIDDTLVMFGGYRTTWGASSNFQCQTTTTTTGRPMRRPGDVIFTTPGRYTTPRVTTTVVDNSGVAVAGTFPNAGQASATTVTTTTAVRRLQGAPSDGQDQLSGPTTCDSKFYFDDLWIFDPGLVQWVRHETTNEAPLARKGHSIVVRRPDSDDPLFFLFGGHNQDQSLNDMWILDVRRGKEEREWTRIDPFLEGVLPPSVSYHSMVYSEALRRVVTFGGLHWGRTNLTESDRVRNIDRRCFKEAQGLPKNEQDTQEAVFVSRMRQLCQTTDFCCALTRTGAIPDVVDGTATRNSSGGLDLLAISTICRRACEAKAFYPEFYPILAEGVWGFQTDTCMHDCSGHGICDMSFCVCEPEWYGRDCSQRRCPGSTCYAHPRTREQHCVECSQHGRCVEGECVCAPGWGYADCSAALCEANCSSTPVETRGVCIEDFPAGQCHCFGHWSGPNCSELLCPNGCSQHGVCQAGACHCDAGYHGADCSLFFLSL